VPKCGLPPPIECIRRRCCVTDRSWASALSWLGKCAFVWRCQNLEREYRGPRVVRPGILVPPFRSVGRAPRSADTHRMRGCLRHSHPNAALFQVLLCLPTAPGLPLQGNGDFGTSAFFGQLSDKPLLACIWSHGVRTPKRNGWWKIKRWAPSWRIAVVQLINWLGARSFEFNRAALAISAK
jgi:hypothetical protein